MTDGIIARFEHHVGLHGTRPALLAADGQVSYAALNRAANRVAHALLALPGASGAGDRLVAMFMAPTAARIVAAIGILKAGFAYVPVNPAMGDAGVRALLADADPRCVLTDAAHDARLAPLGMRTLDIAMLGTDAPDTDPGVVPRAEDVAYIRYTSGSSGAAKGVIHTHRAAIGQAISYNESLSLTGADRVSVLAFFAHAGVLGALAAGAALQINDPMREGLRRIAARLRAERISVLQVFPSAFRQLAVALEPDGIVKDLRAISFTGEPLSGADVALARRILGPDTTVVNKLGSSEFIHIASCVVGEDVPITAKVPAGFAPNGVALRLEDEGGNEVPRGEAGEVVVECGFMGSGYWRRPDLTSAVFGVTPKGVGTYRTGDLGRFDARGRLVVIGRVDNQIKLNGYRTSPEEIEAVLRAHPSVVEVAIGIFTDIRGETRIAAHIVAAGGVMDERALRDFARERLPGGIVPSVFRACDALPMTPGGKLDRGALGVGTP